MFYPTPRVLRLLVPLAWLTTGAVAAPNEERIEALFRPFLAERMTLSPDGRYIAYSEHSGSEVLVRILDLEQPGLPKTVIVQEDLAVRNSTERERASLRFLRWTEGNRLVFAPSVRTLPAAVTVPPMTSLDPDAADMFRTGQLAPTILAPIMAVDANGTNPKTLVDAADFISMDGAGGGFSNARTNPPEVLGFAPGDRQNLLIKVRGFADEDSPEPTRVYRLHTISGKLTTIDTDSVVATTLHDRQGYPRIIAETGGVVGLGTRYRYSEAGSTRRRLLTALVKATPAADFAVTPQTYYGERAIPLGFGYEANLLIYASNVGRDTYGVYGLDLQTMTRSTLTVEHPHRDLVPLEVSPHSTALVLDEAKQVLAGIRAYGDPPLTIWLDAELAEAQRAFNEQFPRRSVEILEWSDDRTRFLLNVSGGTDPGRLYVFKRPEGVLTEISRRAPWLSVSSLHETRPITFPGPDGSTLSGFLTRPRTPRITPMPLVIVYAPGFPATPHEEFDREAQVLADMGLAVLRLNQRGVLGRGMSQRDAMRAGADTAATADAKAAIEWVAARMPVDRKRIVTMGEGFGGYLALRAAQLAPELFRCVIATEPIVEPVTLVRPEADFDSVATFSQEANRLFLESNATALYRRGVVSSGDPIQLPAFVVYRGYLANDMTQGVARLRSQLKRRDLPFETVEVREDYRNGMPKARTQVYKQLEEFLNLNLYNYDVKLGTPRETK